MKRDRPKIGILKLASCSGCQLTLFNCEEELPAIASAFELVECRMIDSSPETLPQVDLLLVEGAVTGEEEWHELQTARERSRFLVAMGACATDGGVLADPRHPAQTDFPPTPVTGCVDVDGAIPGCPVEKDDLFTLLGGLLHRTIPELTGHPLCFTCRMKGIPCLLIEEHLPCLGPLTRSGCGARCPASATPCEGCRGLPDEPPSPEAIAALDALTGSDRYRTLFPPGRRP